MIASHLLRDTGRSFLERLSQLSGKRGTGLPLATMPTVTKEVDPSMRLFQGQGGVGAGRNLRGRIWPLFIKRRNCSDSILYKVIMSVPLKVLEDLQRALELMIFCRTGG